MRSPGCFGVAEVQLSIKRMVVLLLVVVFIVVFVLVVDLGRTCCLVVRCWLGCRSRGVGGRGWSWLFGSAVFLVFRVIVRESSWAAWCDYLLVAPRLGAPSLWVKEDRRLFSRERHAK